MLYIKIFLRTSTFRILNKKIVSNEVHIKKLIYKDFLLSNLAAEKLARHVFALFLAGGKTYSFCVDAIFIKY